MVHRTYVGVTDPVRAFDALTPYVQIVRELQAKCHPLGVDDNALRIVVDGLETAAFHFTRRPLYYEAIRIERAHGQNYFPGLGDLADCITAFDRLEPLTRELSRLKFSCRPFGRDYLALNIPQQCLGTAAYHFTRLEGFYGARSDSAGPLAPGAERRDALERAARERTARRDE